MVNKIYMIFSVHLDISFYLFLVLYRSCDSVTSVMKSNINKMCHYYLKVILLSPCVFVCVFQRKVGYEISSFPWTR